MTHIQGGVYYATTKKALKEQVSNDPESVGFFNTSPMGPQWSGPISELPDGVTLTIVGPDPDKSRKWYANIRRVNGKFKVT